MASLKMLVRLFGMELTFICEPEEPPTPTPVAEVSSSGFGFVSDVSTDVDNG